MHSDRETTAVIESVTPTIVNQTTQRGQQEAPGKHGKKHQASTGTYIRHREHECTAVAVPI